MIIPRESAGAQYSQHERDAEVFFFLVEVVNGHHNVVEDFPGLQEVGGDECSYSVVEILGWGRGL